MSTLFYRNSRLLISTIVLIFVWGISSYFALPKLEDPELLSRTAFVKTFLPGARAARIESLITDKIEDKFTEIEEIKKYSSTSSSGGSIILLYLKDSVQKEELEDVWSRIQNKIDEVKSELPAGASEPELEKLKVKAYALIIALTWQDKHPNYGILNRQGEVLKDRIQAILGTEEVKLFGDQDEEILIEINPTTIASYNLTAADISQQIQQSDSKASAGQLHNSNSDLSIEVAGELDTLNRVQNIPISFGSQGQFVRIQDIATVTKGVTSPANELSIISDRPGVTLAVHVESATKLNIWAKNAEKVLKEYRSELPSTIELKTVFAQNRYVEDRINSLILNLVLGGGLVFLVTLIMMGWRSAIIVGTSLPLSILMVFGWMNIMKIPLHQMSVMGLIVALGILIDNGIIMVDKVTNHLKNGFKPIDAINNSLNHLAVPLLSSTITTILSFLPIALLPGETGEFIGTIAVSVILAVSSSLFLALAIIPALTAKLTTVNGYSPLEKSWWQTGISVQLLTRWYRKTLKWAVDRPVLGICLALLLPVIGFIQVSHLPLQFFPAADRDQLQIQLELPAATSIAKTQAVTKQIRDHLLTYENVTDVHWFIGRSAPKFYYNVGGGRQQEANYAQAIIQLNLIASNSLVKELQGELDRVFPSARILVQQLKQGPFFNAPVEMRIFGSDLDTLQQLGEKARSLLIELSEITHTRASLAEIRPQLEIQVNEEEVRLAGLNRDEIAQQLDSTLEGATGGSILESTEELPVRVRLSAADRAGLNNIASLNLLPAQDGSNNVVENVPLSSLSKITLKPELAKITRYNGQRVNTVQGFLTAGTLPDEALTDFKHKLTETKWQLPNGYSYEFGGEAEQKDDALGGLVSIVGVLTVLMVATLVLSLDSFRLAGVIGVVAIASCGLGLFSIWLFGYPFGFNPIIGTVGLIGVGINDSIVVLAAIQQNPVSRTGNKPAIREVVLHSTRHVIATTLTTAIGFVPLLLGGGEFWPPLAVAIAGGVMGATLLALYLIPAAYLIIK
ncbi:efflux RND transporter permease subunit [Pleurocapsa sp. PCC 7319]|uniref:efflux RND transporter permease subunit n=1 Tax=Pleurocapsa sp. PCC 7319 TaxID=118161 RepID=UPI00034D4244|nr:efflux RND transporter permease subunit [Pleurocapsa sp. PCC 7319]